MFRFKTYMSIFLLCLMIIVLLLAYSVLYINQDHICFHQGCQACLKVEISKKIISAFKILIIFILSAISYHKILVSKLKAIYNFNAISITPVSLKIILLN